MARLASKALFAGERLTEQSFLTKLYSGFTGNAQTSYTAMVYNDGKVATHSTGDHQQKPIHEKIALGEVLYLDRPYEGSPRKVVGKVDVDNAYSSQTIAQIRKKPTRDKCVTLRLAVGVEYDDYIGHPIDEMHANARRLKSRDFK